MQALNNISEFYSKVLHESHLATEALDYLLNRGFKKSTLVDFNVGYSPDILLDYIKLDALKYSDISKLEDIKHLFKLQNGLYSDRFKGRITFPLVNSANQTTGFAARSVNGDLPKYLNSSESHVYSKSRCLFGLQLAYPAMYDSNYAILCEGYTDAMAFHQSGKPQAVACGGTYATSHQLALIARYTKNLILAFDADDAGDGATSKTFNLARSMGFTVRLLQLKRGKDPAEALLQ